MVFLHDRLDFDNNSMTMMIFTIKVINVFMITEGNLTYVSLISKMSYYMEVNNSYQNVIYKSSRKTNIYITSSINVLSQICLEVYLYTARTL